MPDPTTEKPSLFVHIGYSKTGSTTIQRMLQANVDTLRKNGLLLSDENLDFPESGPVSDQPLWYFAGLLPLAQDEIQDASQSEFDQKLAALLKQLTGSNYRGAVISSEVLSSRDGYRLFKNLRNSFTLHTLLYVRHQDEWIQSGWKQWGIKSGLTLNEYAEECIKLETPDFLKAARNWGEISNTIRVVPMNGVPDIVRDCLDWLGLENVTPANVRRENQSYDWSILEILQKNPYIFTHRDDNTIFNLLDRRLPGDIPKDSSGFMSTTTRERILTHFDENNAVLHAEFFPDLTALEAKSSAPGITVVEKTERDSLNAQLRFQGFNILMLSSLSEQLDALEGKMPSGLPKLRAQVQTLKTENKELKKKVEILQQKMDEMDKKMARSWKWRLRKLFGS